MSDIQPIQIVIILIFLGALFAAQIIIKTFDRKWKSRSSSK